MSYEMAVVGGMLGINYFLVYFMDKLDRKHSVLKIGMMILSWITVLITLGAIHTIIVNTAGVAADLDEYTSLFYQVWVWLTFPFILYWVGVFIFDWFKKLYLRKNG